MVSNNCTCFKNRCFRAKESHSFWFILHFLSSIERYTCMNDLEWTAGIQLIKFHSIRTFFLTFHFTSLHVNCLHRGVNVIWNCGGFRIVIVLKGCKELKKGEKWRPFGGDQSAHGKSSVQWMNCFFLYNWFVNWLDGVKVGLFFGLWLYTSNWCDVSTRG